MSSFTDDLSRSDAQALERETLRVGEFLFSKLHDDRPHVFERRWWDERLLAWSMHDEAIKVQMFRFVDVLPMLHSGEDVARHLDEYLGSQPDKLPGPLKLLLGTLKRLPFTAPAVARAARLSAADMARRFIAGENVAQVLAAAKRQRALGRAFTLDILGEAVISEREAEAFFRAYVELIESVAPQVNAWPEIAKIDRDASGPLPRMNLSIKLSALDSRFDAIDPAGSLERAGRRLRELLRIARRERAFVNVDMESYEKKDLTLHIFRSVLAEPEFREVTDVGIVIQCYLPDAGRDLAALSEWAKQRGTPVWVRIVKGAYWDHETILAQAHGWPAPVYQEKWQSDANYERQSRFLLAHRKHLRPAFGSHNLRSLAHALAYAARNEIPPGEFELQMLYGMADAEKQTLVDLGHRLRIYMPYGELIPGMAYLVRRLLENTSNDSFLKAGFIDRVPVARLMRNPEEVGREIAVARQAVLTVAIPDPFAPTFMNQPPIDFAVESNRLAMQAAIEQVGGELGASYPLVINGEFVTTDEQLESRDPALRSRVVGRIASATAEHAAQAVAAAKLALPAWRMLGAKARGDFLRGAAQKMRERLFELAAWEVYECGKQWREATADIDEAIDFCEYYATEAEKLQSPHGVDVPGEENRFDYLPRGVTAVIAPWNFPLAILTGMTTAALATGNTVIMKPAEQSSVIAALLMEIFNDLDLPPGVLQYLPGKGEVVGAALVDHPDVALVAFTGSRAVGLAINARAAELSTARGATHVKRVIAELGGKNAIIVDSDADLDEAVVGVMRSAFGYQGQKCSACSRAIIVKEIYDVFLARLIEATQSLQIGPPTDPANHVGPVIDDESRSRIQRYIETGKQESRPASAAELGELASDGCYVAPHIFAEVPPKAKIAQEEIFGPVLAVIKADDFDDALRIANDVDYALTGGVFSRSPVHLEKARSEFLVGNLYLNRAITGALVGRQPFGGFKMSGIGSKAGGQDYLLQFVLPRTITEHTVRRGFAPK